MAALRAGDERMFRDLFARSYPMMKRVARSYVASDAVAEEVVQETWMAVVAGIEPLRRALGARDVDLLDPHQPGQDPQRARAKGGAVLLGRAERRRGAVGGSPIASRRTTRPGRVTGPRRRGRGRNLSDELLSLEARERLKAALAQLPDRQRLIVGLRDVEGLSAEEVCELLGLSQENQRVLLHRGRSRLRAVLEEYVDAADA